MSANYERVFEVVSLVPKGKVATYGDIAALAGRPGAPRWAGQALANLEADRDIPWFRVINAQGKVSLDGTRGEIQRQILATEGIQFSASGRVNLKRYRWRPEIRVRKTPES